MKDRGLLLKDELERDLRILKEHYKPQRVILFGSLNRRKINEWSDIDLVIVKDTKKPFFDRLKEVLLLLKPRVGTDILVYTPQEYEGMKERLFFKEEIEGKGTVIYEGN